MVWRLVGSIEFRRDRTVVDVRVGKTVVVVVVVVVLADDDDVVAADELLEFGGRTIGNFVWRTVFASIEEARALLLFDPLVPLLIEDKEDELVFSSLFSFESVEGEEALPFESSFFTDSSVLLESLSSCSFGDSVANLTGVFERERERESERERE